jgi:imidazolonepropionase-like amidohydrolase
MWQKNAWYESELEKDRPLLEYLPPYLRTYWTPEVNDHLKNRDREAYIAIKQRLYERYLQMVGRMQELGVPLLAGTDMGANPLCHPGEGVHNELEALVEAGLTPLQALRTATLNPAVFLGIEANYGTVETGKKADLVVLGGNPLESIGQTRNIAFVLRDGQLLDAARLSAIRQEILEQNRNEP